MSSNSPVTIQVDRYLTAQTVAPSLGKKANEEQARKIARDFESFFLSQMLQPMFREVTPESPFAGGAGEDAWRSFQVDEYGKTIARTGGIGIADMVYREILKAQESR
ncbi:MAG: rod-binding protein [Rhodospirillales bacterium]|nr:rod-binding protein [Rhodospirillales bacterium]